MDLCGANLVPLAAIDDTLLGSFGVAAAVLLVGGSVLIRWQRNRQQFLLLQTALLQGLKQFPAGTPAWLATLRQGITTLALGIGLIVVGGLAYVIGARAQPPTPLQMQQLNQQAAPTGRGAGQPLDSQQRPRGSGRPGEARPGDGRPGEARPGDGRPSDGRADVARAGEGRPGDPPPRNFSPAQLGDGSPDNRPRDGDATDSTSRPPRGPGSILMDHWHFAQSEKTVGLLGMAAGIVLTLLGLVQVAFSGVEHRHTPPPSSTGETSSSGV